MKTLFLKFFNFYLYSSLHISLGAIALLFHIQLITKSTIGWSYYVFVFASTLLVYCFHRIIGLEKVLNVENKGRFLVINHYKHHIRVYAIIGAIGAAISFLYLPFTLQKLVVIPGIISLLYIFPLFSKKKRLRDFNYIKIFLIAIVWAMITAWVPYHYATSNFTESSLLFAERFCFFMAITLPFDIRDAHIDRSIGVKTLATLLGNTRSKWMAMIFSLLAFIINILLYFMQVVSLETVLALALFYSLTSVFILLYSEKKSDYYFTGLFDGLMILYGFLVFVFLYL